MLPEVRGGSAAPLSRPPTGILRRPGVERGEREGSFSQTHVCAWVASLPRGEDVTAAAAIRRQSSRVGWERRLLCLAALGSPRGSSGEGAAAVTRVSSRQCRGCRESGGAEGPARPWGAARRGGAGLGRAVLGAVPCPGSGRSRGGAAV